MLVTDIWVSRAARHGPFAASVVLALLVSIELIRIALMVTGAQYGKALPAPPRRPIRSQTAGVDVTRIVSAHLFGEPESATLALDPASAPRSAANLALTGTVATRDPRQGKAIIGEPGQFKVYSVGQRIGEASLHSVYPDRVVLERNGSLEALILPRSELPAVSAGRGNLGFAGAAPSSSAALALAQPELATVDKITDSNVESDADGTVLGIRVVPGADVSAFTRSGLIGGDVVVAVNGTKLDSTERSEQIWKQVSTGTSVTVLRRGKTQDLTLNFAP